MGNINAKDADIVAGTININGFMFKTCDNEAIIGNTVAAVAVFEENSVNVTTNNEIEKMITKSGNSFI